jgi:hypothetical protein
VTTPDDVGTDEGRRSTADARRRLVIASLKRELDASEPVSAAARLSAMLDEPRSMVVSADIDGLVSAAMLAAVAPGWQTVALVVKSDRIWLHPDLADGEVDLSRLFGVDVFSTYMDNVSNHTALWGGKRPAGDADAFAAAQAYDQELLRRGQHRLFANPSLWAGIEGSYPSEAWRPTSAAYRYPLGTAQILLALLEAGGRSPRLFDREYLPYLVANADGGLRSIREYPYNVPLWWSCMAAAVGPASLSEQLYQLASTQRPTEFVDVANRLRAHSGPNGVARHLTDDWNVRGQPGDPLSGVPPVLDWLTGLSGWPDPLRGGAENLAAWQPHTPLSSGTLAAAGLPGKPEHGKDVRVEAFRHGLRESLAAVHTNFSYFRVGGQRLGWVGPWEGAVVPDLATLPTALQYRGIETQLELLHEDVEPVA